PGRPLERSVQARIGSQDDADTWITVASAMPIEATPPIVFNDGVRDPAFGHLATVEHLDELLHVVVLGRFHRLSICTVRIPQRWGAGGVQRPSIPNSSQPSAPSAVVAICTFALTRA